MAVCNLLVYGGGNCELAALLEAELSRLMQIESPELKIFARGYILEKSCLAMYKRFSSLKEQIGQVKKGGLYEYFYDGVERIERQELMLEGSAYKETFEEGLQMGIKWMEAKEVTLVMIGQSNESGLFFDFAGETPCKLTYTVLDEVLYKLGKRNNISFDVIMDIPIWHGVEVPYSLTRNPYIKSLFIYERSTMLEVFPIAYWIQQTELEEKPYLEVLHKHFAGYIIKSDQECWQLCMNNWKGYWNNPSSINWKQFYDSYKEVVIYTQPHNLHQVKAYFKQESIPNQTERISEKEFQDYLIALYHTTFDYKNIKLWLTDFKTCADYHKL